GRWQRQNYDDRGSVSRRIASSAESMDGVGRSTMRLLPGRPAHECCSITFENSETQRRRYRFGDDRKRVPMRNLCTYPRSHTCRRQWRKKSIGGSDEYYEKTTRSSVLH